MSRYALQDKALGICDRCGFAFRLNRLASQVIDQRPSGILVCPRCMDIDQEQLQVGKAKITDPLLLRNPRPDNGEGREPLIPYDPPYMNSP